MIKKLTLLLIACLPLQLLAEENAELTTLIDEVTEAYGGDRVRNLKSLRIENKFLVANIGQGHSPLRTEVSKNNVILSADLANKRFHFEAWANARAGYFQSATFVEEESGTFIDYQNRRYNTAPQTDLYIVAGGTLRTNDTFLVYEMNRIKDQVTLTGKEEFMGRPHTKLTMPFPSSPDLTLYIDDETKLVSRMLRINPQVGDLDYIFDNHRENGGVIAASDITFSIAGDVNLASYKTATTVGIELDDDLFKVPADFSEAGERVDGTVPVANKISNDAYHVGQGPGFSLIVRTSDGVVAAGGYPGIGTRMAQFHEEIGAHYPLMYQVITHHHNDHLGGIGEAAAMGAKLLTPAANFDVVKETVTGHVLEDSDFMAVGERMTIGTGKSRVELYNVSTAHSDDYLVVYLPGEKTVFLADHVNTPFKEGLPNANRNIVTMYEALQALDLDIKQVVNAHSSRVFSMKDLAETATNYVEITCVMDRPICF